MMKTARNALLSIALVASMSACRDDAPQALGTLEYDRITLPAPAAERIVAIDVREGQRVAAGQSLLRLEAARTQSATQAAQAEAQRQQEALAELEAGPRSEAIAQARAQLAAAGYLNVHDVDYESGVWTAEGDDPSGRDVELKVDPATGKVIGKEKD